MTNDYKQSRLLELYRQKEKIENEIRLLEQEINETQSNQKKLLYG